MKDTMGKLLQEQKDDYIEACVSLLDDAYHKGYNAGHDKGYADGHLAGLASRSDTYDEYYDAGCDAGYDAGWDDALSIDQELSQEPCEKLMKLFGTDDVLDIMRHNHYNDIRNKLDNSLAIGDRVILPTNDDGVVLSYRVDTGTATCLTQDGRVLTFADAALHRTGTNYVALAQFIEGFTTN